MKLLHELASEIYSMFAGDAVMSIFVVIIVCAAAVVRSLTALPSYLVGFGLIAGCLILLTLRVISYSAKAHGR